MIRAYLFRSVEVVPKAGSEMKNAHTKAKGAYVDCIVPATDERGARALLDKSLREDQYDLVDSGEMLELGSDGAWTHADTPAEYVILATRALKANEMQYGPFRCW